MGGVEGDHMSENTLATVDPISDKVRWSAKAAIGDAMSRCEEDAEVMIVWMTKDGKMRWSKHGTNAMVVYMLTAAIQQMIFE